MCLYGLSLQLVLPHSSCHTHAKWKGQEIYLSSHCMQINRCLHALLIMNNARCEWVQDQEFLKQVKGWNSLPHPCGAGEEWSRSVLLTCVDHYENTTQWRDLCGQIWSTVVNLCVWVFKHSSARMGLLWNSTHPMQSCNDKLVCKQPPWSEVFSGGGTSESSFSSRGESCLW